MTMTAQRGPLPEWKEAGFSAIHADARRGLSDALDLIIIHNEKAVRGNQPRATLNGLTILLAVAAWERFIADCRALQLCECCSADHPCTFVPGNQRSSGGGAYLRTKDGRVSAAAATLSGLTDGRLPGAFRVVSFNGWSGVRPTVPVEVTGMDLAAPVFDAIGYRNGVAHRSLSQQPSISDAEKSVTIQAGHSRAVVALMLQIISQATQGIVEAADFSGSYAFPSAWFEPDPHTLRGVSSPGPLWPRALRPCLG